jgi:putative transposase
MEQPIINQLSAREPTAPALRKTFQYKLQPTPTQERALEEVLWLCRTLYNTALEQRLTWWRRGQGKRATRFQQEAELKELRAAFPEYAAMHSHVLQDVLARLDRTYQAFFRRVQAGEKPGFPRFQGRNRYHSFTFKEYGNGAYLDSGYLVLSKIGRLAVRWSRPLQGTIKTVTVSREADGWYVSFSCAEVPTQPLPLTSKETGVDVGLQVFLMTAEGQAIENPRHYRRAEKALAKAQHRLSRRKKRSKRWWKAARLVARKHQKVRRQRRDFHQKTALALVRAYDTIYVEDLRVANLVRNHHLAKSISDAGWARFRTTLAYKAACAGKQVVLVEPAFTTQDCSGCGTRVPKSLSVRTHVCPSCGFSADRDHNAALNILRAGQARRGAVGLPAVLKRESAEF